MKSASKMPRNIANMAKEHKKCLTSFEVNVPDADENTIAENFVFGFETEAMKFGFLKFKDLNKIRKEYEALKTNYERECGDLTYYTQPDTVFLMATNELDPGFKKTQRYKYLAVIEVYDEVVQFLWLHPYLRNKDVMTKFFVWYAEFENMICVQPPVSKQFSAVLKKVQDKIIDNKTIMSNQMKFTKRYFKKRVPGDMVDSMTDDEIHYVRHAMETFCAMMKDEPVKMEYDVAMKLACETAIFIHRTPGAKEEMTEWAKQNVRPEEVRKKIEEYKRYG